MYTCTAASRAHLFVTQREQNVHQPGQKLTLRTNRAEYEEYSAKSSPSGLSHAHEVVAFIDLSSASVGKIAERNLPYLPGHLIEALGRGGKIINSAIRSGEARGGHGCGP